MSFCTYIYRRCQRGLCRGSPNSPNQHQGSPLSNAASNAESRLAITYTKSKGPAPQPYNPRTLPPPELPPRAISPSSTTVSSSWHGAAQQNQGANQETSPPRHNDPNTATNQLGRSHSAVMTSNIRMYFKYIVFFWYYNSIISLQLPLENKLHHRCNRQWVSIALTMAVILQSPLLLPPRVIWIGARIALCEVVSHLPMQLRLYPGLRKRFLSLKLNIFVCIYLIMKQNCLYIYYLKIITDKGKKGQVCFPDASFDQH